MTTNHPETVTGLRVLGDPNGKTVVWSGDGGTFMGEVSPWVLDQPDGDWYGRRSRQDARRFPSRHAALAHVIGGCPECTLSACVPGESSPSWEHCCAGCQDKLKEER